jgi:hypothetical protein
MDMQHFELLKHNSLVWVRSFRERRRILLILLLSLVATLVITKTVRAETVLQRDSIPEGSELNGDAFLFGDEITVDGTVIGDVLAVGTDVTINGVVEGSVIALGESVSINGEIGGSTYIAAVTHHLDQEAVIARSLYFLGARLVTGPDTFIGSDLIAVSLGADLSGEVGRDVRATIGILELADRIFNALEGVPSELVPIYSPGIEPKETIAIRSTLQQSEVVATTALRSENASKLLRSRGTDRFPALQTEDQVEPQNQTNSTVDWLLVRGQQLLSLLIVGGLVVWLKPALFARWTASVRKRPVASTGFGFVVFVMGFVGAILLAALFVAIGAVLRMFNLNALSINFWGLSLSGLSFAFWAFILFALFISKIIVSFLAGQLILGRIWPRTIERRVWPLLLGLIIYVLLRSIPVLGWVVGLLVTLLGLGAVWLVYMERNVYKAQEDFSFEEE